MKEIDPRAVELLALCRSGRVLAGQWPLATMPRLASGLAAAPGDAQATWQAQGTLVPVPAGQPQVWLQLSGSAQVWLQCQRCLQLLRQPLQVDRRLRFVRSEEEAARLDEESDNDVLVLAPRLDLHALFEDELILTLPLVPRHAECPEPLSLPADKTADDEPAPNPFAALAALRKRGPP